MEGETKKHGQQLKILTHDDTIRLFQKHYYASSFDLRQNISHFIKNIPYYILKNEDGKEDNERQTDVDRYKNCGQI